MARRLQATVRETDTVGRPGGDEFAVVACQVPGGPGLAAFVSRMMAAACQPVELGGRTVVPAMSVGAALATAADGPTALLAAADAALYQAKNDGRGRWQLASRLPLGVGQPWHGGCGDTVAVVGASGDALEAGGWPASSSA